MVLSSMIAERRRAPRFEVKEHTFAIVRSTHSQGLRKLSHMSHGQVGLALFKSRPAKMGQIIDLSLKGLRFTYIANDESLPEGDEVDILFAEEHFYLPLPCRIVRERVESNELPFTPIVMKQRAVAFKPLSTDQELALRGFLKTHGRQLETLQTS